MTTSGILTDEAFGIVLGHIRPRLVRFCMHLCHDLEAANDLAQDALLVAWRRRAQLTDPSGLLPWLMTIARNLQRNRVRAQQRCSLLDSTRPEQAATAGDLTRAFEDQELMTLLDRALSALHRETRILLVLHYITGLPNAALAKRLDLSEGALAVRLHRARQALREVVLADPLLREEACAYGLVPDEYVHWHETRIWCPVCGAHRYVGRFAPGTAELWLRCPGCAPDPSGFCAHTAAHGLLDGIVGYRAALNRTATWAHHFYSELFLGRTTVCVSCGGSVRREVQHSGEALMSPHSGMAWHFVCRQCGSTYDTQLLGVALARPETRAFWRTHQRIRSLPIQSLEIDGREALLVCFEPLAGGRQLELVLAKETSALLAINGGVQS